MKRNLSTWGVAIGAVSAASSVALTPTNAKAALVPIAGGGSVSGLTDTALPTGTVVTSQSVPFSGTFGGSSIAGTLFSEVLNVTPNATTPTYDFIYQVTNTGGSTDDPISGLSLTSFAGFHTSVGYSSTAVQAGVTGSVAPSDVSDPNIYAPDLTASGDVVRFNFNSPQIGIDGTSTYTLIVATDATSYVTGNAALTDDAIANAQITAPAVESGMGYVPEPASVAVVTLVGGMLMCRRQRKTS